MSQSIPVLTKELYFRPGENVHIQLSSEFPDYIGTLHTHKYIEVAYVMSGSAIHEIAGKSYHAKRGDLFIINMDTPHVFRREPDEREPFIVYDLMFTLEFFDSSITGDQAIEALRGSFMFYSLFQGRSDHPPYFSVTDGMYSMFGELFHRVYMEYCGRKVGYTEIIRAYLLQLIITIFRMDNQKKDKDSSRSRQAVAYVVDYINQNYSQSLSVSTLANEVYLNPDYLGRIFRDVTGMTVSAMIQKVRIEQVCRLLSTTDRTVTDIAASCGFKDMKFFYSVFRKHIGMLPGSYRERLNKK